MSADVGTPLFTVRCSRGLSLVTLAKSAGTSESHLSRIERGEYRAGAKLTIRLWKALGGDEVITRDQIIFPEFHAPAKKPTRSVPGRKRLQKAS